MVREPDLDRLTAAERQPRLQELSAMLHSTATETLSALHWRRAGHGGLSAGKHFDRMNVPVDLMRSTVLSWDEIAAA